MVKLLIDCQHCGNVFNGAEASPGIILRIEMRCSACGTPNSTGYGLVIPFSDRLFNLALGSEAPKVSRKDLHAQVGLNNSEVPSEAQATAAEILNAYLIWLESGARGPEMVGAPPGAVIYFIPPDAAGGNLRRLLRERIQLALAASSPEMFVSSLDEVPGNAGATLKAIVQWMKDQGLTVAYIIDLLMKML